MGVGEFRQQRIKDSLLDPRLRRITNSGDLNLRVEVVAHHDAWRDPDSGIRYEDVLEVNYWGRYPSESSKEVYHLGHGLGTIRFETLNRLEPSGVRYQYAESFERFTPPDEPARPWFDPFDNRTYVQNGYCEDFLASPVEGGGVARHLRGWSGSARAVVTTDGGDEGAGRGGRFEDAQAMASSTGGWERVAAEATVGAATTAIRIRGVRDGANRGDAYYDGMTLQRMDDAEPPRARRPAARRDRASRGAVRTSAAKTKRVNSKVRTRGR
jgi:hypothetical protein